MDSTSFDTLTKTLPSGTRRRAVRLLTIVPIAGVLASLLGETETGRASGSGAGVGGHHRNEPRRSRRTDRQPRTNKQGGDEHNKGGSHSDRTCPSHARFAAVEACWAKAGVATTGTCECAWLNGTTSPSDYTCRDDCLCWLTVEGTGWCGLFDPPLPERGTQACMSSDECPQFTAGGQVLEQACVVWPDGGGLYCWPACPPQNP